MRASGAMALGTILVGALGCMPPSIVGFPHPDPAPLGGTETSLLLFAGSGYPEMVDGGAGLSVAGRSGSTGWSITAWGGGGLGPAGFFGIHGEAALDLEPPTEAESARPELLDESRLHVLLGAGFSLGGVENTPFCFLGCSEEPVTEHDLLLGPQVTVGIAGSPSNGLTGGFWGIRLGAGAGFGLLDAEGDWSVGIGLGAGGGWRWRGAPGTFVDLQLVPFGTVGFGGPGLNGHAGAELILGLSFGGSRRAQDDSPAVPPVRNEAARQDGEGEDDWWVPMGASSR